MSAPPIPTDVDLRDFAFMPIDIVRLFGSEFHARANDAEWRAGVTLWLKSFHQVPAASIPDDDIALARLAEFGRDVKAWRKVRAMALHGWERADDGRLYHSVVAEKALEGWIEKLGQRKSSGAGNAKKYGSAFDPAPIDAQIDAAVAALAARNPHSRLLKRRPIKGSPPNGGGTPNGDAGRLPSGDPSGSQGTTKGQEEVRGSGRGPACATEALSPGWQPDESDRAYLLEQGRLTEADIALDLEGFRLAAQESTEPIRKPRSAFRAFCLSPRAPHRRQAAASPSLSVVNGAKTHVPVAKPSLQDVARQRIAARWAT